VSRKPDALEVERQARGQPSLSEKLSAPQGKDKPMPTYLVLGKYTAQGLQNIKDVPKRAQAFREAAKKVGVTVKELLWLAGDYDVMTLVEAPDEETVIALSLSTVKQGNLTSSRMRTFTAAEAEKIIAKVT
jgi:uncharacterized protein with GYD domain